MPDQPPIIVKTLDFRAGAFDRARPWVIPENAMAFIENMVIDRPGTMDRRLGAVSIGAASGSSNLPYGLFTFYDRKTFDREVLFSANEGQLFMWPGTGDVLQKACGVSLTRALHMGSRGFWLGNDALYVSNAQLNDSNQSLASLLVAMDVDQSFSQNVSMAPLCTVWWQGRLWVGGNRLTENNETLWWSALNDGMRYSLTNTVQVEPGRGGRITGLFPPRGESPQLLIFKEDVICLLTVFWGSSSALIPTPADALDAIRSSIRVIAENVGCIATKSIQYAPGAAVGDIFFLSKDGVRSISRAVGDDTVSGSALPISQRIQDQIDRINFAYAHKAVSGVWNNKYHLGVPLDGAVENTHVLTYDLLTDAWYLNDWDPKDFTRARLNQSADKLLFQNNFLTSDTAVSGATAGWHVYRAYSGDVDPSNHPVNYRFDTRAYDAGLLDSRKKWSWFGVMGSALNASAVLDIQYRLDDGLWAPLGSLSFPVQSENLITLGVDPLPWGPEGVALVTRKISLEDLSPSYTIQFRVLQTSASDFATLKFAALGVAGRPVGYEFSNEIT